MARNGVLRSTTNRISGAAGFIYNRFAVQLGEQQLILCPICNTETLSML